MYRRRVVNGVAASTLVILGGCTVMTDAGDESGEDSNTSEMNTEIYQNKDGEHPESPTTLQFGERYSGGTLEVIVAEPTFESSVSTDEEVLELPNDTGLALVPILFFNSSSERRGLLAPVFTLSDGDVAVDEVNRISLADGNTIRTRELFGVERDGRWASHGTGIDAHSAFTTTAVFEIPPDIDTPNLRILFEPIAGMDDAFDDDIIAWRSRND